MKRVFLSLGSNLGNSKEIILRALVQISLLKYVRHFQRSPLYQTTPVSDLKQNNFINAACSFETKEENPYVLLNDLQQIERELGKEEKPKNAPRIIDIDILLFKDLFICDVLLEIPHPRMLERLFVLEPLCSLEETIVYPCSTQKNRVINLKDFLKKFNNKHNEIVKNISK